MYQRRYSKQVRSSVRRRIWRRQILIGSVTRVNIKFYLDILNKLAKSDFLEIFSNLAITLQILLIVSMSVATTEAFFSKIKIIKNYLRNTITQI